MDYKRQAEVFNNSTFDKRVHLIGCGAVGSWVGIQLAKLGVKNVILHDFDTIEEHNLPNQGFLKVQVGQNKAEALLSICSTLGETIGWKAVSGRVTEETELDGIVLMTTDTMSSRSKIYNKAIRYNPDVYLLIEARMGSTGGRIYCIDPCVASLNTKYAKTLYTDEESFESACGILQTVCPTAMNLASNVVWRLLSFASGNPCYDEVILDVSANVMLTTEWSI